MKEMQTSRGRVTVPKNLFKRTEPPMSGTTLPKRSHHRRVAVQIESRKDRMLSLRHPITSGFLGTYQPRETYDLCNTYHPNPSNGSSEPSYYSSTRSRKFIGLAMQKSALYSISPRDHPFLLPAEHKRTSRRSCVLVGRTAKATILTY